MTQNTAPDWASVRRRSRAFAPAAFVFVQHGLAHTAGVIHGAEAVAVQGARGGVDRQPQHITGQQLCMGLRDLAIERYGLLARTVLEYWGVRSTQDFGVLVYALIDRGELRASSQDRLEDFFAVYEFAEAFGSVEVGVG